LYVNDLLIDSNNRTYVFGEHSHLTTVKLPVSAQGKISDPGLMAMGDQPEPPSDSVSDRINA
jgi:hypothetical protein